MSCSLIRADDQDTRSPSDNLGTALTGNLVSSLHRLKDTDNSDGAFFVFGDLSVKIEGTFRLQFNLFEMRHDACFYIRGIVSDNFTAYAGKNWPGMSESTFLTRSFSDQGVRLRLRKEPRTLLRKRGPASDDYQPKHYKTQARHQNQAEVSTSADRQSMSGTSGESPDTSRHSQGDLSATMNPQYYDQRPAIGRGYSGGSFSSHPDEPSSKRPRTNSDGQSQAFSQPMDSPSYSNRMYPDPQQQPQQYHTFSPSQQASQQPSQLPSQLPAQQQGYGFSYIQSPQSASTSSRDPYFPQRLDRPGSIQPSTSSPFDNNRNPLPAWYQPQPQARSFQQAQPSQYTVPQIMAPSAPPRIETGFDHLGFGPRQQSAAGFGEGSGVVPFPYGRMNINPAQAMVESSMIPRRDGYDQVLSQGQNISPGNMGRNLAVSWRTGAQISTTSAPGALESSSYC